MGESDRRSYAPFMPTYGKNKEHFNRALRMWTLVSVSLDHKCTDRWSVMVRSVNFKIFKSNIIFVTSFYFIYLFLWLRQMKFYQDPLLKDNYPQPWFSIDPIWPNSDDLRVLEQPRSTSNMSRTILSGALNWTNLHLVALSVLSLPLNFPSPSLGLIQL